MGRYTGTIRKPAKAGDFGEIDAHDVVGLTAFFDMTSAKRASGPGGLIKGARVSFEIGGNGRAINIKKSLFSNSPVGRKKKYQSIPG